MNVVIVEDHSVLLFGLREILASKLGINTIDGFCTPTKAMDQVKWSETDLLIADLEFKNGECGISFVKKLRVRYPKLRIIAYSSHKIFSVLNELKRSGFNSYVCKEMPVKELIDSINCVMKQSPNVFHESDSYRKFMHERRTVENKFFSSEYERDISLTPTERMVCEKIVEMPKVDNSVLAQELNMKVNTLKKHITSIYKKMNVHSKEGIQISFESLCV